MKKFLPKYRDKKIAHIPNKENYQELYDESINNPDKFWSEQATRLTWFNKWNKVKNVNFNKGKINWFEGGELNACFNCIDRHIDSGDGDKVALLNSKEELITIPIKNYPEKLNAMIAINKKWVKPQIAKIFLEMVSGRFS